MTYCFLDTETGGLSLSADIIEIAYAIEDGPISSSVVAHGPITLDVEALKVNHYWDREMNAYDPVESSMWEISMFEALTAFKEQGQPVTIVGANPGFDAVRLERRWGSAPWNYRLLDIGAYAMPYFGANYPFGLNGLANKCRDEGADIPLPDHSAAGDVATLRECFYYLRGIYTRSAEHRGL